MSISPSSAMRCAAVYACVRVVSEDVAKLPLVLYRRRRNGSRVPAEGHSLYRILRSRPNGWQSSFEWREMMQAHLELRGNAYSYISRNGRGEVEELLPLHPDRVSLLLSPGGDIFYGITPVSDQPTTPTTVPASEILHLRAMTLDGYHGLSTIGWLRETIGLTMAAEQHGAAHFGNGARPDVVIKSAGVLNEEQIALIRNKWEENHRGVRNSSRPAVLPPGFDITTLGVTNRDSQFLELRQFQISDICRGFRIPPHKVADLSRSTFCLPADSLVMTAGGPKKVVDVKVGDDVWSRSDSEGWVLAPVCAFVCSGIDPILRMRTTNRELRLNARHRVLARRRTWVKDRNKSRYEWSSQWVAAGDLNVDDTIVTMDKLPSGGATIAPNGRKLTPGFMKFCGLLLSDGNVFSKVGKVSIARHAAAPYMDYYRSVMKSEFRGGGPISRSPRRDGGAKLSVHAVEEIVNSPVEYGAVTRLSRKYCLDRVTIRRIRKAGGLYSSDIMCDDREIYLEEGERFTRFSSALAARELAMLGFSGTAKTKRVPDWIFESDEDLRLAFIAGYLDGDGSVDKLGRVSFGCVSRALLDQVRHLCMSVGIPVTNITGGKDRTMTLPNGNVHTGSVFLFTCSDPGQNIRIPTETPHYVDRMKSGKPFSRKGRAYPRFGGSGFDMPGCGLSKISSIRVEKSEPVYDLTVSGTHNFVADGIIVHNSNIEHQALEYYQDGLQPRLERFEAALMRDLLTIDEQENYEIEFDFTRLLRGDMQSLMNAISTGRNWGILSANEGRALLNMEPRKDGDEYLEPLNMVPVGQRPPVAQDPASPNLQDEPDDDGEEPPQERERRMRTRENIIYLRRSIERKAG